MTKSQDVAFIKPPTTLQDKVFTQVHDLPDLDAAAEVIRNLGREFALRLPQEIHALEQDLSQLKDDLTNANLRSALFRRVHDLKGQAGTYDYWMITVIGNELCRFIEHTSEMTLRHIKLMEYHIEALKMVVAKRMVGENPAGGQRVINTLHTMAAKVLQT